MIGEILFYYENTAVKMKMKNSILLDSRKEKLTCITQYPRPTRISIHRVISLSTKLFSWSYISLDTQRNLEELSIQIQQFIDPYLLLCIIAPYLLHRACQSCPHFPPYTCTQPRLQVKLGESAACVHCRRRRSRIRQWTWSVHRLAATWRVCWACWLHM